MAALGKPPIATPPALDLRSIQQAIDNIRERFVRLEAQATDSARMIAGPQAVAASDVQRQIATLRNELEALAAVVAESSIDGLAVAVFGGREVAQVAQNEVLSRVFSARADPSPAVDFTMIRAFAGRAEATTDEMQTALAAQVFTRH